MTSAVWIRRLGMLCLLVAAAGCDAAPTRTAAVGGCSPARGDSRLGDALLHVPRTAQAPLPLVVAFHGAGGSAAGFAVESGLSRSADRHGFAVLYPQAGSRRRFWALKRTARPDDVARMRAMLPDAERLVCADSQRVYATGVSNGGGFAARVACEMSDTFAAVAPVAGGYSSLDRCPAGARASVLEIHGSADEIVPYRGRGADHAGDVGAYVAGWARRDGCDARPRIAHPARYVTRLSYPRCDPGYAVEHVRLRGTDHGWPGARSPWPHHDPTGVLAREMVWDFFEGLA